MIAQRKYTKNERSHIMSHCGDSLATLFSTTTVTNQRSDNINNSGSKKNNTPKKESTNHPHRHPQLQKKSLERRQQQLQRRGRSIPDSLSATKTTILFDTLLESSPPLVNIAHKKENLHDKASRSTSTANTRNATASNRQEGEKEVQKQQQGERKHDIPLNKALIMNNQETLQTKRQRRSQEHPNGSIKSAKMMESIKVAVAAKITESDPMTHPERKKRRLRVTTPLLVSSPSRRTTTPDNTSGIVAASSAAARTNSYGPITRAGSSRNHATAASTAAAALLQATSQEPIRDNSFVVRNAHQYKNCSRDFLSVLEQVTTTKTSSTTTTATREAIFKEQPPQPKQLRTRIKSQTLSSPATTTRSPALLVDDDDFKSSMLEAVVGHDTLHPRQDASSGAKSSNHKQSDPCYDAEALQQHEAPHDDEEEEEEDDDDDELRLPCYRKHDHSSDDMSWGGDKNRKKDASDDDDDAEDLDESYVDHEHPFWHVEKRRKRRRLSTKKMPQPFRLPSYFHREGDRWLSFQNDYLGRRPIHPLVLRYGIRMAQAKAKLTTDSIAQSLVNNGETEASQLVQVKAFGHVQTIVENVQQRLLQETIPERYVKMEDVFFGKSLDIINQKRYRQVETSQRTMQKKQEELALLEKEHAALVAKRDVLLVAQKNVTSATTMTEAKERLNDHESLTPNCESPSSLVYHPLLYDSSHLPRHGDWNVPSTLNTLNLTTKTTASEAAKSPQRKNNSAAISLLSLHQAAPKGTLGRFLLKFRSSYE